MQDLYIKSLKLRSLYQVFKVHQDWITKEEVLKLQSLYLKCFKVQRSLYQEFKVKMSIHQKFKVTESIYKKVLKLGSLYIKCGSLKKIR